MKVFLLFAAFCSIGESSLESSTHENAPQKEELKFNDGSLPDLSCILFGNVGCQSTCTLLGKLYTETKNNICNESFECICNFGRSNNLFALWNAKFEKSAVSTKLWTKIRRSSKKLKKDLMSILNQELLSGKEMKKQLESVLGEEVKNLKPNEKELINNFIDEEGQIDDENYEKLVEFINEQLNDDKCKNTIKNLNPKYKQNFIIFMEKVKDETIIKHISHRVNKMLNPDFVDFVNDYLEENKKLPTENDETKVSEIDESLGVKNELFNMVVEALINYIETDLNNFSILDDSESRKSNLQPKTSEKSINPKDFNQPPDSNYSISEESNYEGEVVEIPVIPEMLEKYLKFDSKKMVFIITINPNDLNEILKSIPRHDTIEIIINLLDLSKFVNIDELLSEQSLPPSKESKEIKHSDDRIDSSKLDYYLPEESVLLEFKDRKLTIDPKDMKGIVSRNWTNGKNFIIFSRDKDNDTHLTWNVNSYYFSMAEYHWGELSQTWLFGDVRIHFYLKGGDSQHDWEFSRESELNCTRKAKDGQTKCKWKRSEDKEALKKYKGYIYSWCTLNKELVPKNCILFDY